jgi:hypothetical protein
MISRKHGLLVAAWFAFADVASAQLVVSVRDISPDTSSLDAADSNGASGGRVNGMGVSRSVPATIYAASEWGGLFRSTDGGVRWVHVDGHVPQATWDVEVDPTNVNRVFATSFYDGRAPARSGINVSNDGGATWVHPPTATPPANFCFTETRRTEPAAFGISIDPANASRVFIGTNCGLAMSVDAGATWNFIDATPGDRARDVWDVVVHDGGIIDICGDDGHQRSTTNGMTWTTATSSPLQTGRCSLAVSPDEAYVLFAVVGTSIFESDNGGDSWPVSYANPMPQGRIPFVATNQRQGATFDLWFGDVNVFRGTCTTPSPANPGGARRCALSGAWANAQNDAHWDSGDVAFAPGAAVDACPILFSNDGGIYRNTVAASPACHTPNWDQPTVTPHALFNYAFAASARAGAQPEDVYFGNQDNGSFGTINAGATPVTWTNEQCCDSFGAAAENSRAVTTICCFNVAPSTRMFLSPPGLGGPVEIGNYPPGTLRGFQHLSTLLNFGANQYLVGTSTGVFVTLNIGAGPIVWTQLGAASTPASACGLQVAFSGGTPTFFAKSGGCNGDQQGTLWRYQGTAAGGTWTQVPNAGATGGFGVFAVDRNDPQRLIASHLSAAGPRMLITTNGGTTWTALAALDVMMTGGGAFRYTNQSGPTIVPGGASMRLNGYPQPTLLAFDPADSDIIVAGGADSGVFISTNRGARWQLVTDPSAPGTSGVPHVPRPYYAHFDHDPPAGDINLFLGTRGRGLWRLTFKKVDMPEIQVPSPPDFAAACVGETKRAVLRVCNTSPGNLTINSITSSSPQFTVTTPSGGFPVTVSHDFCFPVDVSFTADAAGSASTTLAIASNDPTFPTVNVPVTASVGQPTAVAMTVDTGNFGEFCAKPGAFRDLDLTINNSGSCPLLVNGISSSLASEFEAPQVLVFPMKVAPGDSLAIPIRFHPSSPGLKNGVITVSTNASTPTAVNVTGSAPPEYVCEPLSFAAIDTAIGPTWGTGRTGNYTYNASGLVLKPFGPQNTFGIQGQAEYMFYPGRQEGQVDTALLYRRGMRQFGVSGSFKRANLRAEASSGALSHATLTFDVLLPSIRVGAFAAKGLRETDVVTLSETIGPATMSGQPIVANERLLHTVDQFGGALQFELVTDIWLDGHAEWLHRHAPGVSDTAGGAVRVSTQMFSGVVFTVQFDVNESYLTSNAIGTFTFGVTLGHRSRPTDFSNPVNPLGTTVPRVHYDVFPRVR